MLDGFQSYRGLVAIFFGAIVTIILMRSSFFGSTEPARPRVPTFAPELGSSHVCPSCPKCDATDMKQSLSNTSPTVRDRRTQKLIKTLTELTHELSLDESTAAPVSTTAQSTRSPVLPPSLPPTAPPPVLAPTVPEKKVEVPPAPVSTRPASSTGLKHQSPWPAVRAWPFAWKGEQSAASTPRAAPNRRPFRSSSFECTGGTWRIHDDFMQDRTCIFHDVCTGLFGSSLQRPSLSPSARVSSCFNR